MCELLFHTVFTHTYSTKIPEFPPRPSKESKEKLRLELRRWKIFSKSFACKFVSTDLDEESEAYSFMLRPIMAEEEAVFRCSSKAEAACQCKKIFSI